MVIFRSPHEISATLVRAICFSLDQARNIGSGARMRPTVRHALSVLIAAVAFAASALNGYASVLNAFDVHAHGPHGLHSHDLHDHGLHDHGLHDHWHEPAHDVGSDAHDHLHAVAADQSQDHGNAGPDEQACKHVHAHCCAAFAVTVADGGVSVAVYSRAVLPVANSHLPPGQIASPLFRPPRLAA